MSFYKTNKYYIDLHNCIPSIELCLHILKPNTSWVVINSTDLEWLDENESKPTQEDINIIKEQLTECRKLFLIRKKRDKLLKETDIYLSISDFPINETLKNDLKIYRQLLRDLPNNLENNNLEIDINNIDQYFPVNPMNTSEN